MTRKLTLSVRPFNIQRLFFILILLLPFSLQAHPLAPGLLALNETATNQFQGVWKLPKKIASTGQLTPVFPSNCQLHEVKQALTEGTGRSQSFQLHCNDHLIGQSIGVDGMSKRGGGVLLRIKFNDGRIIHQMLNQNNKLFVIPSQQSLYQLSKRYLGLGIEHLLAGIDHLLFVITLALLVGWKKQLFWTITFFTIGHSITLSMTALGSISLPSFFVESMIALSICWAATDALKPSDKGIIQSRPWLMSGGFGLLHGMGFAGALAEIGLPEQAILPALAAFNIGIEIGQLLVVGLLFLVLYLAKTMQLSMPSAIKKTGFYIIGITGAIWFWQRLFSL